MGCCACHHACCYALQPAAMCNDTSGAAKPTACVLQCPQHVRMCCNLRRQPPTEHMQQPHVQHVVVEPLLMMYVRVLAVERRVEVEVAVGVEVEVEVEVEVVCDRPEIDAPLH